MDDAASTVDNISQASTPAAPAPASAPSDDAFIAGVRSLRRRLVVNDNSRTVGSRTRKRPPPPATSETAESTSAKLAKTSEGPGSTGHQAVTTPTLADSRLSSSGAGSRPRPPGTGPPTQRAVLRIAQPDGTVCFLAIDNVSDISRLPVTAVVQQLLASQKLASANHRSSLGASAAGLVPGFVGRTPRVGATSAAAAIQPPASVMSTPPDVAPLVCASSSSHNQPVLSVPRGCLGVGTLPAMPAPSPAVLRPPPSSSNALSEAFSRMRSSQNALVAQQLFPPNRGHHHVNLRAMAAQSVNSQQLLNNIMAIRAAALSSSTGPRTSAAAVRMLPVVADPPAGAFAVPLAVTKLSSTSSVSSQPALSAVAHTGGPGHAVTTTTVSSV